MHRRLRSRPGGGSIYEEEKLADIDEAFHKYYFFGIGIVILRSFDVLRWNWNNLLLVLPSTCGARQKVSQAVSQSQTQEAEEHEREI